MASHGNTVITFTFKSIAQSNNLCKNNQLNNQYNMFIFTLLGSIFQMICFIIISKWQLLQNVECKFSESTNNNSNNNNRYHQQSRFIHKWLVFWTLQTGGGKWATHKASQVGCNSDYQSEWFKEWDDCGPKQVRGTIRWNSHGQEILKTGGKSCILEWEEVVTHDSKK